MNRWQDLLPPTTHLEPSNVLDASQKGGSSQLKSSLFSLYRTIKECDVLCNTVCSSSGGQPQGATGAYPVVGWIDSEVDLASLSFDMIY